MKCYICKEDYHPEDGILVGMVNFLCCNCLKHLTERIVHPIKKKKFLARIKDIWNFIKKIIPGGAVQ